MLISIAVLTSCNPETNEPTDPIDPISPPFVSCGDGFEFDSYVYATVQIGGQCWFAENLRSAYYANGDTIPTLLPNDEWYDAPENNLGATTVYGDGNSQVNEGSTDEAANLFYYGRLYNWPAVVDARGLCPSGWHVPTDEEFMTLEMELGMSQEEANSTGWRGSDQGTQMKASLDDFPSWDGTNTSGFKAIGAGYRGNGGFFASQDVYTYFWTSTAALTTPANETNALSRDLNVGDGRVVRGNMPHGMGLSVRCIQDE